MEIAIGFQMRQYNAVIMTMNQQIQMITLAPIMRKETMKTHECIIGLLHYMEDSELCTLSQLQAHIEERADFNSTLANDKTFCNCKSLYYREYTLAEYCDKRVNTNLHQFDYCPICGKKIDWNAIKRERI